ncbi:hypothetical protein Cgig2_006556 [Carnegiea gigantea]|uniref:Uncharacterized protein n=1 Tax=Carnegiea gigantea TaxID=171969 RepID=A0A9Q1JTP0_9CARY|nr:hypothetical protein Cgig2_006556 [Carnegiea gigantea]
MARQLSTDYQQKTVGKWPAGNKRRADNRNTKHTCHGRSQSSGIGQAPNQDPRMAPCAGKQTKSSTGPPGLKVKNAIHFFCYCTIMRGGCKRFVAIDKSFDLAIVGKEEDLLKISENGRGRTSLLLPEHNVGQQSRELPVHERPLPPLGNHSRVDLCLKKRARGEPRPTKA